MITTLMHLAGLSILIGVISLCGIRLWTWLPAICSMTITIHLLTVNAYCASLMKMVLTNHKDEFNDPEEVGMMTTSPGIFIPQLCLFTSFAKLDFSASSAWAVFLSFAGTVLGIIHKNYFVSALGAVVFLVHIFSHIGGMFYLGSPEANMFACVRRYLSKINKNVKSMTDVELQAYALKYQVIIDKLNTIYENPGGAV